MTLLDPARSTLDTGLRTALSRTTKRRKGSKVSSIAPDLSVPAIAPRPFLKWAGGKRGLLAEIRERTPNFDGKYIEPFLGAGAVLFDQDPQLTKVVSDYNRDLIDVYEVIRDNPEELIATLRAHVNTKEHYYEVRAWDRAPNYYKARTKVERAARFCYINRLTYNGLYRVNSAGYVNSPYGRHQNPDWVQEATINAVSAFLNEQDYEGNYRTSILSGDYIHALNQAVPGDWVYCDPPYASTWTGYQSGGFTVQHQTELRDALLDLTRRGIPFLLSNSDVPLIRELYGDESVFHTDIVTVRRAIGSNVESRGKVNEVMINNYRAVGL